MTSIAQDKNYLEAGVSELGDYLLSKELYWTLRSGGINLPQLTIGGVLLAAARLEARGEQIESLKKQIDGVRSKWRVAWETKAGRGVQARMRLWSNYLADYRDNPYQNADAYPHEVRYRVMLQLLLIELPAPFAEQKSVDRLDEVVKTNFSASDFIWEADLQPGFPEDEYWYLYGKLKV